MSTLTWSIIALVVVVLVIVIAHNLWQGRRRRQQASALGLRKGYFDDDPQTLTGGAGPDDESSPRRGRGRREPVMRGAARQVPPDLATRPWPWMTRTTSRRRSRTRRPCGPGAAPRMVPASRPPAGPRPRRWHRAASRTACAGSRPAMDMRPCMPDRLMLAMTVTVLGTRGAMRRSRRPEPGWAEATRRVLIGQMRMIPGWGHRWHALRSIMTAAWPSIRQKRIRRRHSA